MEAIANWFIYNRRRVRAWFQDDVFRCLFINAGKLLSANTVVDVLAALVPLLILRTGPP